MPKNQKVWLMVTGISLHVWEEKNFQQIGSLFGEFLDFDEETIGFRRFDFARILVCTSRMDFISKQLRLEVMRTVFDVWVVEDVVVRKVESHDWEVASSASSHVGEDGGVFADQLEVGNDASPRGFTDVHLGVYGGVDKASQHLLLKEQKGSDEKTFLESQNFAPSLNQPREEIGG